MSLNFCGVMEELIPLLKTNHAPATRRGWVLAVIAAGATVAACGIVLIGGLGEGGVPSFLMGKSAHTPAQTSSGVRSDLCILLPPSFFLH